jgi:hypothetical protein
MASLLDDKTRSIGAPKAAKAKGGNNQSIKLIAALALFAVAGLVFALSQGYISFGGSDAAAAKPTQEQMQQLEEQKQKAIEIKQQGKAQDAGA